MFDVSWLLKLSRWQKRLVSIVADVFSLVVIAFASVVLRLGTFNIPVTEYLMAITILPFVAVLVFIRLDLYRVVVRYISHRFVFVVFSAVSLVFLFWSTMIFMLDLSFPRSAMVIAWVMSLLYIAGSRLVMRWLLVSFNGDDKVAASVIIYGAGDSGRQLMQAIGSVASSKVVAFVDDNTQLTNDKIGSVRIYPATEINSLIERFQVGEVLLAIPSLSMKERKSILAFLELLPVKVSTLPPIDQIIDGRVSFADVRDLAIEDLLGRDVVLPQAGQLEALIKNKVVLVSGAGGSIGSELCRQVIKQLPSKLILFEITEFALYQIEQELQEYTDIEVIAVMGTVLDSKKLVKIITKYNVATIYHAAAYKHVPLVEHNIEEGIRNNSFGTLNIARIAAENKVANFVLISTDKAVRPTNFMGASKRLAEMSLQALQDQFSETRFVMVRFGNVLGSSGSVIPLFKKQIANKAPITLTHKDMTRYFMTIPEAASLVIQAGSMGTGGDVFVLDMGEPVKIIDLAKKIIHLSGLEVMDDHGKGDIEIKFTGLRPGEKLYEELLIGENVDGTEHPRIMKLHEDYIGLEQLEAEFKAFAADLANYDYDAVTQRMTKIVAGFNHTSGVVDYLK